MFKRMPIPALILIVFFGLSTFARVFAEIINEGDQIVRLSGRKKGGVIGSLTIQPGQSIPITDQLEQLSHVSNNSGRPENVKILIIEPDGTRGSITSVGGKYILGQGGSRSGYMTPYVPDRRKPSVILQPGSVKNRSNIAVFIAYSMPNNIRSGILNLQPDQYGTFPKEVTEVTLRVRDRVRDNDEIAVYVTMPDGSQQVLSGDGATARLEGNA